jgi:hypothetical protein
LVIEAKSDIRDSNLTVLNHFRQSIEFLSEVVLEKSFESHYRESYLAMIWSGIASGEHGVSSNSIVELSPHFHGYVILNRKISSSNGLEVPLLVV